MSKGCGIEFPYFGASYPDARCCDGYLWDMDSWDESLGGFTIGGKEPCPVCENMEHLSSMDMTPELVAEMAAQEPVSVTEALPNDHTRH